MVPTKLKRRRVTVTVEVMSHDVVIENLRKIGRDYSQFVNEMTGLLAYHLRGVRNPNDALEVKMLVDDFVNCSRGWPKMREAHFK